MSVPQNIEHVRQVIHSVEPDFSKLALIHGAVSFDREASFALQIMKDNDYLARVAMSNVDSLKRAVVNVAAIGLSLSPVHKLAYLVPRKNKVCLDISYRGFVQLAVEAGAIKWAHAEIVRETDEFKLRELGTAPLHSFSPFKERGAIVGAYCVVKTHDGEFLVTTMSFDEIKSIRDRSESWKAYVKDNQKTNPWVTDESEMIKKTVIRRAYKTWPMADTRRIDEAVSVSSDTDPVDLSLPPPPPTDEREVKVSQIREMIRILDRTETQLIEHVTRTCRRPISAISDMTDVEMKQTIAMLNSMIDQQIQNEASTK